MTENSKQAYINGTEKRITNREKVYECLKSNPNSSRFEVGRITGLGDIESQRRLSELHKQDIICITGSRKHYDNEVSLYSIQDMLTLELFENKLSLRRWLMQNKPEIIEQYNCYLSE